MLQEENFVSDGDVVSFLYDFSMSRWRTRTVDRMTPCKTCPIQMLCGGGCAAANIDDLTKAECKETKEIFTELAPRILWKVRHERFESLRDFDDGGVKEADKTDSGDISNEVQVHSKYKDNHPDCMSLSMREFLSGFTAEERNIMMTTDNERELFDILKAHK